MGDNIAQGGYYCPGKFVRGDKFARNTGSEVANWISYTLIDMAKAVGRPIYTCTYERR